MHAAQIESIVVGMEDLTHLTDEELLAHSLESPSAFEALMSRYHKEFMSRANAVIRNKDEAEDVVQDTFIRIYRFAPKYSKENGSFKSWSLTILMNVARTKFAKGSRHREVFAELTDEHYETLADTGSKGGVDTFDDYIDREEVARVLGKVDADTARLLTLAYIEGLPYEEIAEAEGTTVGAIKARVHRAKAAVRNALASTGV